MGLTLRSTKGSALTIQELDNNFIYLSTQPAITGSFAVAADSTGAVTMNVTSSYVLLPQISASQYYNTDAAAAEAGVPLGAVYLWWDGQPATSRYLTIRVV
jgi:hypothetical protein